MPGDFKLFKNVSDEVYRDNICYRGTGLSIEKMLVKGKTVFQKHAKILSFVIRDRNDNVGRFTLIQDSKLPEYVQVAFFEALPGIPDVLDIIRKEIKRHFPGQKKMVVGLNGHLNYGAGILLSKYNEPPLFGLPYTPPYYPDYFRNLYERRMYSIRFSAPDYVKWFETYGGKITMPGLKVRLMNKKKIRDETRIYTYLNNRAFQDHPYWADRKVEEDIELFYPFRFFMKNEYLIFAEVNGEPAGFLLWYPDFNQLIRSQRELNAWDVLRLKLNNPIDTFRYTEIGIHPKYRNSPIILAMKKKAAPYVKKAGYKYFEAGFIFEENRDSIALAIRMHQRFSGFKPEPYREYAVYEGNI